MGIASGGVTVSNEQAKSASVSAEPSGGRGAPIRVTQAAQVSQVTEPTLAEHVWTVVRHWPTALAVLLLSVLAGVAYLLAATPIFSANAILQVEAQSRGLAGLEELLTQGSQGPAETEIAILRSRSSLSEVVDELGLDLGASPVRFPIVGGALARRCRGPAPAAAPLGLDSFAWGCERIKLRRLEVPDELLDVPLRLTALAGGAYRLDDPDGNLLLEGEAGGVAVAEAGQGKLAVHVAELTARPGTRFELTKRRRADLVAGLQKQLRIGEDGRLSGILVVSLDGPDPARVAAILNAVARNYQRQNVDRKSAEAAQQLSFLESQLPLVKANVAEAEAAFNKFLGAHGAVNLSSEAQAILERSAEVERELTALDMQRSELRQRFTESHPTLTSLSEKIQMLRAERAGIGTRMRQMPEAEANSARLQNDLRVATELYSVLLNKAQELRVVKSGTVGNVRILDPAIVPHRPAWPRPGAVLALSALLGILGGVGGAFVRNALARGVEDADDVEAGTGLPVYATIPHSEAEEKLIRRRRSGAPGATVLAASQPQDVAVECVRSLRTSLEFALVEAPSRVVVVSGPSPVVGKSFVCANLAQVLASAADRRVLVVDADLRRGRLHRYFGAARKPGLSDVLGGSTTLSAAIRRTDHPWVDLLPTGSVPPNASELLSSNRFRVLLEGVSRSYAYVVVDTPPVLAVTDAAIVARHAGVTLLVLKGGEHSMREIVASVKRFTQGGSAVQGLVLNDVRATAGRYGRHGRYQRYEYRSDAG